MKSLIEYQLIIFFIISSFTSFSQVIDEKYFPYRSEQPVGTELIGFKTDNYKTDDGFITFGVDIEENVDSLVICQLQAVYMLSKYDISGQIKWRYNPFVELKRKYGKRYQEIRFTMEVIDKKGNTVMFLYNNSNKLGDTIPKFQIWFFEEVNNGMSLKYEVKYDNIKNVDFFYRKFFNRNDSTFILFIDSGVTSDSAIIFNKNDGSIAVKTKINIKIDSYVSCDKEGNSYVYAKDTLYKTNKNNFEDILYKVPVGKEFFKNGYGVDSIILIDSFVFWREREYLKKIDAKTGKNLKSIQLEYAYNHFTIRDEKYIYSLSSYTEGRVSLAKYDIERDIILFQKNILDFSRKYYNIKEFFAGYDGNLFISGNTAVDIFPFSSAQKKLYLANIDANTGDFKYETRFSNDSTYTTYTNSAEMIIQKNQKLYIYSRLALFNKNDYDCKTNQEQIISILEADPNNGNILSKKYIKSKFTDYAAIELLVQKKDEGALILRRGGKYLNVDIYDSKQNLTWTKNLGAKILISAIESKSGKIIVACRSIKYDTIFIDVIEKDGTYKWRASHNFLKLKGVKLALFYRESYNDVILESYTGFLQITPSSLIHHLEGFSFSYPTMSNENVFNYLQDAYYKSYNIQNRQTTNVFKLYEAKPFYSNYKVISNSIIIFSENFAVKQNLSDGSIAWKTQILPPFSAYYPNYLENTIFLDNKEKYAYEFLPIGDRANDSFKIVKIEVLTGKLVWVKDYRVGGFPNIGSDFYSDSYLYYRGGLKNYYVSPNGEKFVISGSLRAKFNPNGDNTYNPLINLFMAFDSSGNLLTTQTKSADFITTSSVSDGTVFFPDGTYWFGGMTVNKNLGQVGVIYSANGSGKIKTVNGRIYFDKNKNNINDSNDLPLKDHLVLTSLSQSQNLSNSEGKYSLFYDLNNTDTLKVKTENRNVTINPKYYLISGNEENKDFAFSIPDNLNDVAIKINDITPPRIGFNNTYLINYKNLGSTVANGKVNFIYNNKQFLVEASTAPTGNANQTITWNYTNLQPNESREIKVTFKTALDAQRGSQMTNVATIDPLSIDTFKTDNVDSLVLTVVGSYDPNDKQVTFNNSKSAPAVIDNTTELTYTIRFQNTGNYPADFVKVTDTLSDKLDISTLRIIATSHKYDVSLKNKNVLTFDFNPIFLPDSTSNEKDSHGFIKFAIKPKKTLTKEEVIKNTGYIFFDYNPAIITNTVETANQKANSLFTPSVSEPLSIYPNPTTGLLTVKMNKNIGKEIAVSIYSIDGKLMISKHQTAQSENTINGETLHEGLYILQIKVGEDVMMGKFLVKK